MNNPPHMMAVASTLTRHAYLEQREAANSR